MGRGSDTRMYNPRSESSHMFRENHEEEGTRTGYEDPRDLDNRADKRQAKKEKEDKEDRKIKHIKVRRHHLRSGQDEIDEEEGRDDSTKLDADREVGLQTNPTGTGGFLTSLATQAKGPGAAAGQLVAMSEPMKNAWSELLKQGFDLAPSMTRGAGEEMMPVQDDVPMVDVSMGGGHLDCDCAERLKEHLINELQGEIEYARKDPTLSEEARANWISDSIDQMDWLEDASCEEIEYAYHDLYNRMCGSNALSEEDQMKYASEPMKNAWSELLKQERPHQDIPTMTLDNIFDRYADVAHLLEEEDDSWFKLDKDFLLHYLGDDFSQHERILDEMMAEYDGREKGLYDHVESPHGPHPFSPYYFASKSKPMDHAWSELLKMTEAEMLDYYRPENMIQRERARLHRGGWDGGRKNMPKGRADEIMREEEARKDKMISAGVPPELVYAHHDYEPRIRAFSQVPPNLMGDLPVQDKLELIDSRELARRINMQPAELYHQRRMAQTMLPPPFDPPSESSQQDDIQHIGGMHFVNGVMMDDNQYNQYLEQSTAGSDIHFEQKNASEPMFIGDVLVKSKKDERKRKKEMRTHWRPSTGAFELPKGGSRPGTATSRRAKIISRNLPQGKKTGLGQAHLSVEMSHRGIASKQPKSKDPAEYTKFLAQQEARRRIGNVRTPYSQPRRFGQPSKRGFRLNMPRAPRPRLHPVRAPRITPPKMKMPRLHKPKMPGMVTMSEDEVTHSDVLKSASDAGYLRILVRELREALRDVRDKDRKSKGMGTPDTSGAGSNLPNHPSNSHAQTSAPQGGTENEDAEAKMYGADPAQVINARGSNKS